MKSTLGKDDAIYHLSDFVIIDLDPEKFLPSLKKCYRTAMKRFIFKKFRVSSHLHGLCKHYRAWSFGLY